MNEASKREPVRRFRRGVSFLPGSSAPRMLIGLLGAVALFSQPARAAEVGGYFRPDENLPGSNEALMKQMPYAYYPSQNMLDVALQVDDAILAESGWKENPAAPHDVAVRIVPLAEGASAINAGTVTLNESGFARKLLSLPDLPDGEYAVEYQFGKKTFRSPKVFKRIHFPWEKEKFGMDDKVRAPFTPVVVEGNTVRVVGRTYTVNGFGLFDSVTSLGRELLAEPMRLELETEDGSAEWTVGPVSGRAVAPNQAVFQAKAASKFLRTRAEVTVEEDGCAKVTLHLAPGAERGVIRSLTLEITLKEDEAELFHFIGDNSMRHNYGGATPRGGKIVWDSESQLTTPVVWRAEPGPEQGVIWDSTKIKQYPNQFSTDYRPFVPYIWLGTEERGLAWFGESEQGYVVGAEPIQEVEREKGKVVIRIRLIGQPITLEKERTIVFGLMASPGKPLPADWRTRHVGFGIVSVVCWGGYTCASKYPDRGDYTIADKIQEARRTGKADEAWFDERAKHLLWPERTLFDEPPSARLADEQGWLAMTKKFAQVAAASGNKSAGTYFEEHATDLRLPEWEVFQDEWSSVEFCRFQEKPNNTGVFSPSYHDFALWHANEWMKRGVSLYFDNTFLWRCYNERFGPAWRDDEGRPRFGTAIWGPREYYKRIGKLMAEWNEKGAPYPIDVTFHMTNTQTLPFNTWCSATLDLEQRYRKPDGLDRKSVAPEEWENADLPWPADYTRAVSLGRQVGAIPLALDPMRSGVRHTFFDLQDARTILSSWGMERVHEISGPMPERSGHPKIRELAWKYENAMKMFGYPEDTSSFNYWDEKPLVTVDNPSVKWLYLFRKKSPQGMLLLQSYSKEASSAKLSLPHGKKLVDVETRESIPLEENTKSASVSMPADYGTRMFLVSDDDGEEDGGQPAAAR